MSEGGGSKLLLGCGCLVFLAMGIFFLIVFIFSFEGDFEDLEDFSAQFDTARLTKEGQKYFKKNEDDITETLIPATTQTGLHWSVLAAILEEEVEKDDQDSCDDHWIGPMKMKELNWSGNQFLTEFPDAKTDFSHCGDIKDDKREQLKELAKLESYRDKYNQSLESCQEKAKNEKKEMFCQAYGMDANDDKKADLENKGDAILSASVMLSDYRGIYGNLGQALNQAYGENEKFLRALKNRLLSWLMDPSNDGIFRWPLDSNISENKTVTRRYQENGGEVGLTIQSKEGEKVFAVGSGYVQEVGSDSSCGEYVKLIHYINENNGNISTVYCNVKDISVKKNEHIEIGKEIGKVGTQSFIIKMSRAENDENTDENQIAINPEEYLTAPNDVILKEEESNDSSDDKERD